jgi:hypothetical protein
MRGAQLKRCPGFRCAHRGCACFANPPYGLQNDQGEIIAIYDVKTGERKLSAARANELRKMTGASPDTPVFELNVVRGISKKYRQIGLELERWYSQLAAKRI